MKVVVLAGGRGSRLGLVDRPKPMVDVAGEPLLSRTVRMCRDVGLTDFVFLNGHLAHVIEDHFNDGRDWQVSITHVREPSPLGTAGAIKSVARLLDETFLVLYGDVLMDVDLPHMITSHLARGAEATLFVHPNSHPEDSDVVRVDTTGRIEEFLAKPHINVAAIPNLVSGALYVVEPELLDLVPIDRATDWGADIFPCAAADGRKLYAYRSVEYAKDIGTPQRRAEAELALTTGRSTRLSRRNAKSAIFLDRDGVINREIGGVHTPEALDVGLCEAAAVRAINDAGVPVFCVTNQPDVAKGFLDMDELALIHVALDQALLEAGAFLDQVYVCPHHPERGHPGERPELKLPCRCRKPDTGLLLEAAAEHNVDLDRSVLVGDRAIDLQAGRAVGATTILLKASYSSDTPGRDAEALADHVCDDLPTAVAVALEAVK